MKKWIYLSIALAIFCIPALVFANANNNTEQPQYKNINGINYSSLSKLAEKFNADLNYDQLYKKITIRDSMGRITVTISLDSQSIDVNGADYREIQPIKAIDDHYWISVKDFANIMNLALNYYKGAEKFQPTEKSISDQSKSVLPNSAYYAPQEWGDKVPESIRKHGIINNITRPVPVEPIYKQQSTNSKVEGTVQGK